MRDAAGQEARPAEPGAIALPARPFYNPLAKALVEQQQVLALDANSRDIVATALDALTIAPERLDDSGTYLGLRVAYQRLLSARSDDDLRKMLDYLWDMARAIAGCTRGRRRRAATGCCSTRPTPPWRPLRGRCSRARTWFSPRHPPDHRRGRLARSAPPTRAPWVMDVRDLWPDVPVALGELSNPRLARAVAERLERRLYAGGVLQG